MILRRTSFRPCCKQCIFTFGLNLRRRQTQTIFHSLSFEMEIANEKFGHVIVFVDFAFFVRYFFFYHKLTVPRITTTISFLMHDPTTDVQTRFRVSDVAISRGSQLSNLVQKHRFPRRISQISGMYLRGYPRHSSFRFFDGSIRKNSGRFTN